MLLLILFEIYKGKHTEESEGEGNTYDTVIYLYKEKTGFKFQIWGDSAAMNQIPINNKLQKSDQEG